MESNTAGWDRREFLKTAGAGLVVGATLGARAAAAQEATPTPTKAGFRWMSLSNNTAKGATDRIIMNGNGSVSGDEVDAVGSFTHYDTAEPPDPKTPKKLLGFGTWKAQRLVSLKLLGTYGAGAAGTIVMDVVLHPEGGSPQPAQLTMNCNVPQAGLSTGRAEGFFLTVAGMNFEPWVLPVAPGGGPPQVAVGASVFNVLDEGRQ